MTEETYKKVKVDDKWYVEVTRTRVRRIPLAEFEKRHAGKLAELESINEQLKE